MTQTDILEFDTDDDGDGDGTEGGTAGETFVAVVTAESRAAVDAPLRQVLAATRTVADSGLGAAERDEFVRKVVNRDVDLPTTVGVDNPGFVGVASSASGVGIDSAISTATGREIPHFFVDSFASFGESHGAIADRVRELVEGGVEVHVVSRGFDIDAENCEHVLGVLDGLDAAGLELQRRADVRDVQRWLPDAAQAGRPALGFTKIDGESVPGPRFDEVRAVVSLRLNEDIPKQKAAERLGVSPRTIGRAVDNAGRYGLEGEDTEE
ncbi:helix-turn-helix domain-containing protein [Haloarchaeobius sp. FL176]|uniref:helix-turn-helix domain-containing protein n=1 Tax=Haloarchaeobius sp. FL176 TaxID=2967129 RepID=UPI0021483C0C|nr:helix-turn-helix domain-containing protein [Haloarchaeobius sp. FL176]